MYGSYREIFFEQQKHNILPSLSNIKTTFTAPKNRGQHPVSSTILFNKKSKLSVFTLGPVPSSEFPGPVPKSEYFFKASNLKMTKTVVTRKVVGLGCGWATQKEKKYAKQFALGPEKGGILNFKQF